MKKTLMQRFAEKVRLPDDPLQDGCWGWVAARDGHGYGQMRHRGKNLAAHRLSYTLLVGPIPSGYTIDHLCRNPLCVNPGHLEPVTQQENVLRGHGVSAMHAKKTSCVNGHPFTPGNIYRRKIGGKIYRNCRQCAIQSAANYRAKVRAQQDSA